MTSRPMSRIAVALVAAASGACYQDIPEQEIPCDGDDTCPTGMYCGFAFTCNETLPAHLVVDGASLSEDGPFGQVEVTRGNFARIHIQITNDGSAPTSGLTLVASTPACLNQTNIDDRFADINPDDSSVFYIDVNPMAACPSPQRIGLAFDAAYRGHTNGTMYHRMWNGTVTVNLR